MTERGERNAAFQNRDAFQKLNLGPGMFFDKEHFGEDRVVAGAPRRSPIRRSTRPTAPWKNCS